MSPKNLPMPVAFGLYGAGPDFGMDAKVIASQKAWAKRVMYWHNNVQVNQANAYAHCFPKGPLV